MFSLENHKSTYGTFNIAQKIKSTEGKCTFFILIIFGLLIITLPSTFGIVIGSFYQSNITLCLTVDHNINSSYFLLIIFIVSIIELPIIMCFYCYLIIIFFDIYSISYLKNIFLRLRMMASLIIISVSIFGWIVFCETFYNCSRPSIIILLASIGVFGIPMVVVLYNVIK